MTLGSSSIGHELLAMPARPAGRCAPAAFENKNDGEGGPACRGGRPAHGKRPLMCSMLDISRTAFEVISWPASQWGSDGLVTSYQLCQPTLNHNAVGGASKVAIVASTTWRCEKATGPACRCLCGTGTIDHQFEMTDRDFDSAPPPRAAKYP